MFEFLSTVFIDFSFFVLTFLQYCNGGDLADYLRGKEMLILYITEINDFNY